MKILILGAGAMGCLFAAYLARTEEVTLADPNGEKLALLRGRGVTVLEPDGAELRAFPRMLTPAEASSEPADLVLVFVKASREREALAAVRGAVGEHTLVMTLQNGMGHEEAMLAVAPAENLIVGATQHNASLLGPGIVRHGGAGYTEIGAVAGDAKRFEAVAAGFTAAGIETRVSADVARVIWHKLFMNASASALTAVFRCPLGPVAEQPHIWSLARKLIAEAVAVARAEGQAFDEEEIAGEIRAHLLRSKGGYTSICADLEAGRRTEVDAITGAVAARGRAKGVPTPLCEAVAAIIHGMEELKDGSGN